MHALRTGWPLLVALAVTISPAVARSAPVVYAGTFDANGATTITAFSPAGVPSVFADTASFPMQFPKFGPDGNLYASSTLTPYVHRFSPAGVDLGPFNSVGLNQVWGTAFDKNGNLFVASGPFQNTTTIYQFTPTGALAPRGILGFARDVFGGFIYGIAIGPDGRLYAAGDSGVLRAPRTGGNLVEFVAQPPGVVPVDLAFDSQGNLYVANYLGNEIHKFSATGADLGTFASVMLPSGLAFGPGDNLFVLSGTSPTTATIKQFTPFGIEVPYTNSSIDSQGGFPAGIAVGPNQVAIPEPSTLLLFGSMCVVVAGASGLRTRFLSCREPGGAMDS